MNIAEKMAKKDSQPDRIGDILEKSLKRLDPTGRLQDYGVWPIWDETVGPFISRNAQPEKIRHGTLFVKVTGPTWMQQLQYMKEVMVEKLNERLGKQIVKNIFFIVGRVKGEAPPPQQKETQSHGSPPAQTEPDEELLRSVRDPEIRQSLKRLLLARHRKGKRG